MTISGDELFGKSGELVEDSLPPEEKPTDQIGLDLAAYPVSFLLNLRAEIDAVLPPMVLSAMNLEQELVRQYQTAKALQTDTLTQRFTEANKKAQVVNTTASTLQSLVKMQADFFSAERFKKIEMLLIACLRDMPKEETARFFERYERELGGINNGQDAVV